MIELKCNKVILCALLAYINPNSSLIEPIKSALKNAELTSKTTKLVIERSQISGFIAILDEVECGFAYAKKEAERAKAI